MKKFSIAFVLLASLGLAACSTTSGNVNDQIRQVQDQTRFACSFVPTVETVAKILATFVGGFGVVDAVGTAARGICDAITTAPLADGPGKHVPVFNGVVIKGRPV